MCCTQEMQIEWQKEFSFQNVKEMMLYFCTLIKILLVLYYNWSIKRSCDSSNKIEQCILPPRKPSTNGFVSLRIQQFFIYSSITTLIITLTSSVFHPKFLYALTRLSLSEKLYFFIFKIIFHQTQEVHIMIYNAQ